MSTPPDVLIKARRPDSGGDPPAPAAKSTKSLVKCMVCGDTWTCARDSEAVEVGRAHAAETTHTRVLIVRSVHDAA